VSQVIKNINVNNNNAVTEPKFHKSFLKHSSIKAPMILVVNASDLDVESKVEALVTAYDKHFKVKSRNMTATSLDMVIELRTSKGGELVRSIMKEEGILSASLLSHDGEVTF
jgi:hypothetical protein